MIQCSESEEVSTQWARCVVAGAEPFIQTGGVELLLACLAAQFWKRIVAAMYDREANHAVVDAFEAFVDVSFPQDEPVHYTAILEHELNKNWSIKLSKTYNWIIQTKSVRRWKNTLLHHSDKYFINKHYC